MSAGDNKEQMRAIFDAAAEGDFAPLLGAMADEVTWDLKGSTPFSKVYAGKEKIASRLLGPLRQRIAGLLTLKAGRLIAEGELVVVEARGNATTTDGVPYNNTYCFIFRLEDGRIREITEYVDTQLVMNAFGQPAGGGEAPR